MIRLFPETTQPRCGDTHGGNGGADTARGLPHENDATVVTSARAGNTALPEVEGYRLVEEIGRGNMGVVYKASQISLNRLVALKMIRGGAHAGSEEFQRFLDEARVAALLHHPNIVQIHDVGVQGDLPYFAMEYVGGGNLAQQLNGRPLPAVQAAALLRTLALAIHEAHTHGIVHRDLKPANILLENPKSELRNTKQVQNSKPNPTSYSAAGLGNGGSDPGFRLSDFSPKVSDFGLAKRLDAGGQTQSGVVMGTPNYMAPEQAEGRSRDVGPAADIYALGAILYECLTGRPPYNAESPAETVLQIFQAEPVAPSRLQPRLPRDLETICLKCLQREPHKRYASTAALADDLGRFLSGETILARPPLLAERAWKWARRRPALATLLASSAVALLFLTGLLLWHQADLQIQLDRARTDERQARSDEETTRERARLTALETRIGELLRAGEAALARRDWQDAKVQLSSARAQAASEASLASLQARAAKLLLLADSQRADRERFQRFQRLRNDALFNATLFTGGDLASSLQQTRDAATEALALYGVAISGDGPPIVDSPHLQPREKEEVRRGCYELLLVLAEALAQPVPGQNTEASQEQARLAIQAIDRAARLGTVTRAYHLRRAAYLARVGDDAQARHERDAAERMSATSALDHFLLGAEQHHQGRWHQAIAHYESALQEEPDHFWAQYYLALCRLQSRQPDLAVVGFTACLAQRPDFVWIYLLRGSAHVDLGQFSAAEADFSHAQNNLSDNAARYALYVNRGVLRFRQGKLNEAVEDLRHAVELQPQLYQGQVNLAQIYLQRKQFAEAIRHLDLAIAAEPELAALYRARAKIHAQRDDLDAALADLDRATALDTKVRSPAVADDHFERGRILLQRKDHGGALAALDAAVEARPNLAAAHRLRAECLTELKQLPEAVEAIGEALKHGSPSADLYRVRAVLHVQLGEYPEALTDYARALELEPDAATYTARGWTYLIREAPKLAFSDFTEAIRLDPDRGDAYAGRGYARVLLGRPDEGAADAETALQRGPESPRLLYNAARVYAQAVGRLDEGSRRQDLATSAARARYEARALQLLTRALDLLPATQRTRFWNDYIRPDAALNPLRRSPAFSQLAAQYARTKE